MDIKQDIIKRLGRDDPESSPNRFEYWRNGNVKRHAWVKFGRYYRNDNLPTQEEFYKNGNIKSRSWCKNHKLVKKEKYDLSGNLIDFIG